MKYLSTFTGVGGFDMGVPPDWECVGMSEIDKYANMVLRYRFKDVKNYGDIEKVNYEELPDFDIQIGGSPCQDISMAGKREGLSGVRSRLFFSYVAILKVKKPRYFIFENVKGLLSSNEGRDFAEVTSQFTEAGYDIWWQVLDASDFGIPQHRERVFILGTLGERGFRKVFLKRKDKGKNHELQRQQANTITKRYGNGLSNGSYVVESKQQALRIENLHFDRSQQNRIYGVNGVAPTLDRKNGGNQVTKIGIPVRQADGRGGNANGRRMKSPDEPSFTLQSSQRQGVAIPVRDVNYMGEHANGRRFKQDGDVSFTNRVASRQGVYNSIDIRYLTPLECERLQGWPDDWTKYGIDEKGNAVEISDNARYNLIGNGVVPQVVRELIGNVMIASDSKEALK
jgi:DNA (cytosine-5)-methyltransferase 1